MGWHDMWQDSEKPYMTHVDNYSCFMNPSVYSFFKGALAGSSSRLLFVIDPALETKELLNELDHYNESHPMAGPHTVRLLSGNRTIWKRASNRPRGLRRPAGASMAEESDFLMIQYIGLLEQWKI